MTLYIGEPRMDSENKRPLILISRRLKAIADPSRLSLLHALCDGERNVSQLVLETGLTQANISKHLRILREEGLVSFRREQKNIYYGLSSGLPEAVCDLVCRSLEEQAKNESAILEGHRSGHNE
jgi:DNA-binding transcriptional ArsR family regulator